MDHQLIGVLFLSLSHLYLFIPSFLKSVTFLRPLSVCLSVSIFVYLSISLLRSVWPFNSLFICPFIWLSALPSFYLSVFSAFLAIGLFDCLSLGASVHLSILGPLKSKYKIKAIFYMLFSKAFMSKKIYQKNIKIGKRKLRHKMIKQKIVLI